MTPSTAYANNTTNPNCHIFALTWNTTGFSALSIQLEGSDDSTTWTAFSGSAVVTGSNPATTLSGAMVINASTKIAYLRVNLTSATGTGGVNYQVFGVAGASASLGNSGGGGTCTLAGDVTGPCATNTVVKINNGAVPASAVAIGTNSSSQPVARTVSSTDGKTTLASWNGTAPGNGNCASWTNGDLGDYGTNCGLPAQVFQVGATVTLNSLVCLTNANTVIRCPTTTGISGPTVLGIALATAGSGNIPVNSYPGSAQPCIFDNTAVVGDLVTTSSSTAGDCSDAGQTAPGNLSILSPFVGVVATAGTGTQTIYFFAPGEFGRQLVAGAVAGATVTANGLLEYDSTNNNLKTSQNSADAVVVTTPTATPVNGDCVQWVKVGGRIAVGDTGSACGSATGTTAFSSLANGTNTTAAMLVGTGSSLAPTGTGTLSANQLNGVPFCAGFTPTTLQFLQYTAASSPNPCYTAATGGGATPSYTTVSFSATPTFTVGANTNPQNFQITMTAPVTGSTLTTTSATTGQDIAFKICQDATGSRTFVWPTNVINPGSIPTTASTCGKQIFRYDGTNAVAFGPMVADGSTPGIQTPTGFLTLPTGSGTLALSSAAYPFTIVQESQATTAANVGTFTITFPQATASSGNTAWMFVATDGSASVGLPAGWTADINQTQATFSRVILMHKATASDTGATFTLTSSSIAIYFFELSGSHALDQSTAAGIANAGSLNFPAITPTANSVVFGIACLVTSTGGFVYIPNPISPLWHPISLAAFAAGGRGLVGYVSNVAAAHVSTAPPSITWPGLTLTTGGGIAYAVFSIL